MDVLTFRFVPNHMGTAWSQFGLVKIGAVAVGLLKAAGSVLCIYRDWRRLSGRAAAGSGRCFA